MKINKGSATKMLLAFARDKVLHKTKDSEGRMREKKRVVGVWKPFLSIVRTARVSNGAKFRRCLLRAKVLSSSIDFDANFWAASASLCVLQRLLLNHFTMLLDTTSSLTHSYYALVQTFNVVYFPSVLNKLTLMCNCLGNKHVL